MVLSGRNLQIQEAYSAVENNTNGEVSLKPSTAAAPRASSNSGVESMVVVGRQSMLDGLAT